MNRLSNIFASTKLAKLHLAQAREDLAKDRMEAAGRNICHAIECVMASINNVASIAFEKKRKRGSR